MNDYISRRDLLARYDAEHNGAPDRARELIEQAPAADVAPVMRGVPSVCGKRLCSRFNNYCPSCGTRMEKEAGDE